MEVPSSFGQAWFLPAILIRVSVWSTQKTQDLVVFCPLMIPSTTSSRSSALVLSQFFSPDLIRTFSTSIGMVAPESTCSILSLSVSLDRFMRLNCFSLWGCGWDFAHKPRLYPESHLTYASCNSKNSRTVTYARKSSYGFSRISRKPLGYSRDAWRLWNVSKLGK